jgi:hypothetical protein
MVKSATIFSDILLVFILFSCSTHSNINDNRAVGNWDIAASTKNAHDEFELHITKGKEYENNENLEEAINEYLYCIQMINGLEYGYYFLDRKGEYLLRVNILLLSIYEKQGNYGTAIAIIDQIIRETPSTENYLYRAKLHETVGNTEMSEYDKNIASKLDRAYYVSSRGYDNNEGRSEQSPFGTLEKAIEAAKKGAIKTVVILGVFANIEADEGPWRKTFYSINNAGDEILIIGKHSGSLIASGENLQYFNPTVININGNFRFANIKIYGGNTGMIINSGANVVLDTGVIVGGNTGGGSNWLTTPNGTGIVNNGNLIIQSDAKILNNSTASTNSAGGITNNGTLVLKNNVIVSGNKSMQNRDGGGGNGGGILNNGILTIQDSVIIYNNSAISGEGIYNNGTINLLRGEITDNISTANGGGIFINSGTLLIRHGIIKSNKSEYGAGIYITRGSNTSFTLINGRIENNNAKYVGGGIYIESNARFIQNSGEIINNTAGDGDGNNIFRQ